MVAVCAKNKLTLSDHEVKTQKNQAIVQKNPLAIQSHLAFSTRKCGKMNGRITLTRRSQHCHTVVNTAVRSLTGEAVTNLVSELISNA
jgi:hypothetical protein